MPDKGLCPVQPVKGKCPPGAVSVSPGEKNLSWQQTQGTHGIFMVKKHHVVSTRTAGRNSSKPSLESPRKELCSTLQKKEKKKKILQTSASLSWRKNSFLTPERANISCSLGVWARPASQPHGVVTSTRAATTAQPFPPGTWFRLRGFWQWQKVSGWIGLEGKNISHARQDTSGCSKALG